MSKHKEDEIPQQEAPQEPVEEIREDAPETTAETPEQSPEAALKAAEDRYLRLAAEYDNFRKRSARERDAIFADVRADTVLKFLPVYDNLVRAIAAMAEEDPGRKGVEMTLAQFETVLTKLGVTPIPALGEPFNPEFHNAVMHVEDEAYGENVIIEEFEKGFQMGDKIIRFSMVKVAN
jgi:molecular chaperone GrpE